LRDSLEIEFEVATG